MAVFINSSSPAPWYVGLTEACYLAVAWLSSQVPSSMTTHFYGHIDSGSGDCNDPGTGKGFGSGSIEIGSTIGSPSKISLNPSADADCIVKQGFGFDWRGCVAHLSANRGPDAVFDLERVKDYWDSHSGFILFAADLNLNTNDLLYLLQYEQSIDTFDPYWDIDDDNFAFTFSLGDNPRGNNLATEKLDWVFGRDSFFHGSSNGSRSCDANYSDHCYLYGRHRTS